MITKTLLIPLILFSSFAQSYLNQPILFIDEDNQREMTHADADNKYDTGGTLRGLERATVNPGVQSKGYKVLPGSRAGLRTTNQSPQFQINVPMYSDVAVSDYAKLVRLTVKGDTRRIVTARRSRYGGYGGFSDEDKISTSFVELPDKQFTDKEDKLKYTVYRIKPDKPLPPGEYALVIGFLRYYDFGVDSK